MSLNLSRLAVGDIIETRRTERVTSTTRGVYIADVQSGQSFYIDPAQDNGSLSIQMVKKSAPEPKVNDTYLGSQVKAMQWQRGTLLQSKGNVYLLDKWGAWVSPDFSVCLDSLGDDAYYKVIWLP